MPKVSEFYGIAIYLYFNDHAPPHFHARYQGDNAEFEIATLAMLDGRVPPRVRAMVLEWASNHRDELLRGWNQCRDGKGPDRIAPLE